MPESPPSFIIYLIMNDEISKIPASGFSDCACLRPLPRLVVRGLELFNAGDYFQAHEFLEEAWRGEPDPIRELYRGILQVGVGFYHIQRRNYNGAHKLFQRALGWLAPFLPICQGVNVEKIYTLTTKIDAALIRSLPNPSRPVLESLFFTISFTLI